MRTNTRVEFGLYDVTARVLLCKKIEKTLILK